VGLATKNLINKFVEFLGSALGNPEKKVRTT
jgi:hypothetical protein